MTLQTRPLFSLTADVDPPQITPNGPYGERRFMPVTGGKIVGDRLNGAILNGGSDCQLIRPDAVAELDVRVVIEADDGTRILMKGLGIRHGAPEIVARLQAGERVAASEYYFRETFLFEAPPGPHEWLNKIIGVGVGERQPEGVAIEVFEIL